MPTLEVEVGVHEISIVEHQLGRKRSRNSMPENPVHGKTHETKGLRLHVIRPSREDQAELRMMVLTPVQPFGELTGTGESVYGIDDQDDDRTAPGAPGGQSLTIL